MPPPDRPLRSNQYRLQARVISSPLSFWRPPYEVLVAQIRTEDGGWRDVTEAEMPNYVWWSVDKNQP